MERTKLLNATLFKTLYGSKLYGTNTDQSDTDWKYIFLPPLYEVLLGKQILKTKFVSDNLEDKSKQIDEDFVPFQKFASDFVKGVPYAIEVTFGMLSKEPHAQQEFSDWALSGVPVQVLLQEMVDRFLNRKLSGFLGFLNQKALDFRNIPFAEQQNLSKDQLKDVYHCLRIGHQTLDLLNNGSLTLPYDKTTCMFLKSIKQGKVDYASLLGFVLATVDEVEKSLKTTKLRELTPGLQESFETWLAAALMEMYGI
jgi:predicted nucleotidyltransferase